MALQQTMDDLIANAINLDAAGGLPKYSDERPGVTRGDLHLLCDLTFNGGATSATVALEFYLEAADTWFPVFDSQQTSLEATFTATTKRWQHFGKPSPARIAHRSLPLVGDLWRLELTASGPPFSSVDFTLTARTAHVRHVSPHR